MEIVTSLPTGATSTSNGTKKHVEEWSRLDRLTGMLEHARVEADHWASNTSNSRHHFGQVIDCRARNLADGSIQQQQQTKQLEVFQAHIPGVSVQVIKSHTSTTSSWHNSKVLQNTSKSHLDWSSEVTDKFLHRLSKNEAQMDDLKLHHNLVNLNSEKTKANIARFLPSRRPPTRNKLLKTNNYKSEEDFFMNLSKTCHDSQNETEKQLDIITKQFQYSLPGEARDDFESGFFPNKNVTIVPAASPPNELIKFDGEHEKLEKKKSISDENILIHDEKENSDPWKRTSKTRRSFQHPTTKFKNEKAIEGGSEESETSKSELETVLEKVLRRKGEHLQKYDNGINEIVTKKKETNDKLLKLNRNENADIIKSSSLSALMKRKLFVTEETLKQTKQKLRHLNAIHLENKIIETVVSNNDGVKNDNEEADDGICTESKSNSDKEDEKDESLTNINRTQQESQCSVISTTGSLENRSKNKSDDWFDRRRSYGFEPMYGHQRNISSLKGASSPKMTNLSTDSGICHSSELELISTPIIKRLTEANDERIRRSNANAFMNLHTGIKDENDDMSVPKSGHIGELLKKFEKKSEIRDTAVNSMVTTAAAITLSSIEPNARIMDNRQGKIMETITSLRENSENATAFEPTSSMIKLNYRTSENENDLLSIEKQKLRNFRNVEDDILSKRHSIACEDTKYMISILPGLEHTFQDKLSNSSSSSEPLNTTVVNVNNFEEKDNVSNNFLSSATILNSINNGMEINNIDLKKPKKVEFSKTEVHFAVAEPGKIKIVETNEKPPPANLYRRKKRSVSLSPKIRLPQFKFGTLEKFSDDGEDAKKENEKTKIKINDNSVNNEKNSNNFPFIDFTNVSQCTSSASDNGLAVRISSTIPHDSRRTSCSTVDVNENKSGYSTRINFGGEGVTIIADAKPYKYDNFGRNIESNYIGESNCLDTSRNEENFQEKLIVRIGGCGGSATSTKYVQNRFTNSFRNFIYGDSALNNKKIDDEELKSTSLIMDTIKKSSKANIRIKNNIDDMKSNKNNQTDKNVNEMKKKIKNDEMQNIEQMTMIAEQPSTYITEMNKLQQRYRHRTKENRSVDKIESVRDEKIKMKTVHTYNTVPSTKNGIVRSRSFANDLPSVLKAFDKLQKSIDRAIDENKKQNSVAIRSNANHNICDKSDIETSSAITELPHFRKFSHLYKDDDVDRDGTINRCDSTYEKRSSHSWFLNEVVTRDNGNISDDSLKADEEVRSYMSTAIMEEYENELAGSWSRRRYFKHIKPVKIIKEDKILEKSHFKPLRNQTEESKTVTSSATIKIKKPKITSVALNVNDGYEDKNFKKCTTVLLNNECKKNDEHETTKCIDEEIIVPTPVVKMNDISVRINTKKYIDEKRNGKRSESIKITGKAKPTAKLENDSNYKAIRVIHHGVRLPEKETAETRRLNESTKKIISKVPTTATVAVTTNRKTFSNKDPLTANANSNLRTKKTNNDLSISDKDKLFDSGRDSWLNIPKESKREHSHFKLKSAATPNQNYSRKSMSYATATVVREKCETYQKNEKNSFLPSSKIPTDIISKRTATYTDVSSEDNCNKRITYRKQHSVKPLSTISEKANSKVDGKVNPNKNTKITNISINKVLTNTSKMPVTRTTSDSSLESRSNSYEFKNPVLKTEERSKRRAARMLQRATSREALLKAVNISSSEDVTSENEVNCLRNNKLKSIRKTKSPKCMKLSQSTNTAFRSKCNRMIQQKTAKMEINIFNIKEKPSKKMYNYENSRSHRANVTVIKTQSSQGQKEININTFHKSNNCGSASNTINVDNNSIPTSLEVNPTFH